MGMDMYIVFSAHTKPGKNQEFKEWLQTDEVEELISRIEDESGIRYIQTYFSILGFGEYTYETWYELDEWSDLDRLRDSEASTEFAEKALTFIDQSRSSSTRVLRTSSDVQITEPDDA